MRVRGVCGRDRCGATARISRTQCYRHRRPAIRAVVRPAAENSRVHRPASRPFDVARTDSNIVRVSLIDRCEGRQVGRCERRCRCRGLRAREYAHRASRDRRDRARIRLGCPCPGCRDDRNVHRRRKIDPAKDHDPRGLRIVRAARRTNRDRRIGRRAHELRIDAEIGVIGRAVGVDVRQLGVTRRRGNGAIGVRSDALHHDHIIILGGRARDAAGQVGERDVRRAGCARSAPRLAADVEDIFDRNRDGLADRQPVRIGDGDFNDEIARRVRKRIAGEPQARRASDLERCAIRPARDRHRRCRLVDGDGVRELRADQVRDGRGAGDVGRGGTASAHVDCVAVADREIAGAIGPFNRSRV